MKKLALNNSNTAGMSDVFKSGNTLRCSSAKVHSSCKGLLFIFLEQNGTSSSLLLMDAVMTNNNEAYLQIIMYKCQSKGGHHDQKLPKTTVG